MGNNEMPFLDHLEELRWRLIRSFISILLLTIVAFAFSDLFLKYLILPAQKIKAPINLQVLKVQAIFVIKLELAVIVGVVASIPYILYQIWGFIAPGLNQKEKKYIWPIILVAMISFLVGASFAYFIIIPYALDFFLGLAPQNIANNIALDYYFGFMVRLILVFGIVFELPVLSMVLSMFGLITPKFLRKYRRHAIVVFFIAAAILTPPDPTTQILLAVPMVLLYEVTIWVSFFFSKRRKTKALKQQ